MRCLSTNILKNWFKAPSAESAAHSYNRMARKFRININVLLQYVFCNNGWRQTANDRT